MDAATTTRAEVALTGAKIIAAVKQSGVEFIRSVPDIVTSAGLLFPIADDKSLAAGQQRQYASMVGAVFESAPVRALRPLEVAKACPEIDKASVGAAVRRVELQRVFDRRPLGRIGGTCA